MSLLNASFFTDSHAGIIHPLKSAPTLMIPRSEVERLLADTAAYNGRAPEAHSHGASNDGSQCSASTPDISGKRQSDLQSRTPKHKHKPHQPGSTRLNCCLQGGGRLRRNRKVGNTNMTTATAINTAIASRAEGFLRELLGESPHRTGENTWCVENPSPHAIQMTDGTLVIRNCPPATSLIPFAFTLTSVNATTMPR